MIANTSALTHFIAIWPKGGSLDPALWERLHSRVISLLWFHAVAIPGFGLFMGNTMIYSVAAGLSLLPFCWIANAKRLNRRARATAAAIGLMGASAMLIHLSGGYIEMYFYFFVMIALVALYHDWVHLYPHCYWSYSMMEWSACWRSCLPTTTQLRNTIRGSGRSFMERSFLRRVRHCCFPGSSTNKRGAAAFLHKPVQDEALIAALESAVGSALESPIANVQLEF